MVITLLSARLMELSLVLSILSSSLSAQNVIVINATSTPGIVQIPILERIAQCESQNRHFENGEVLRGKINPLDIGKYQINLKYHGSSSQALGLDLFKEKDNEEYARWLYEKEGTRPWKPSFGCWGKWL